MNFRKEAEPEGLGPPKNRLSLWQIGTNFSGTVLPQQTRTDVQYGARMRARDCSGYLCDRFGGLRRLRPDFPADSIIFPVPPQQRDAVTRAGPVLGNRSGT